MNWIHVWNEMNLIHYIYCGGKLLCLKKMANISEWLLFAVAFHHCQSAMWSWLYSFLSNGIELIFIDTKWKYFGRNIKFYNYLVWSLTPLSLTLHFSRRIILHFNRIKIYSKLLKFEKNVYFLISTSFKIGTFHCLVNT